MTQYDAGEDHYKMMILDFQFYVVWAGLKCNTCGRRMYCGDLINK